MTKLAKDFYSAFIYVLLFLEPEEFLLFAQKNAVGRIVNTNGECSDAYIPLTGLKSVRAVEFDPINR